MGERRGYDRTVKRSRLALDVSNVNPITLGQLRASGAACLIAKQTEGSTFEDADCGEHRRIAREAGAVFGSYLYLRADSAGNEADWYLEHGRPGPGELPPIIDAEDLSQGAELLARRANACAMALEAAGYRDAATPWLYASSSVWLQMHRLEPALRRLPVWEAQYPGRFTRWFPGLARLRVRLLHRATVVAWQWTDAYRLGGRRFDASRLMRAPDRLVIPG